MICKSGKHKFVKDDRHIVLFGSYLECKYCGKQKIIFNKNKFFKKASLTKKEIEYRRKEMLERRNRFMNCLQQRIILIEKANSILYLDKFHERLITKKDFSDPYYVYLEPINEIQ